MQSFELVLRQLCLQQGVSLPSRRGPGSQKISLSCKTQVKIHKIFSACLFHCPSPSTLGFPSFAFPNSQSLKQINGFPCEQGPHTFIQLVIEAFTSRETWTRSLLVVNGRHTASFLRPETIPLLQNAQDVEIFPTTSLIVGTLQYIYK